MSDSIDIVDAATVIKNKLACSFCESFDCDDKKCSLSYDSLPVMPDCKIRKMLRLEQD